MYMVQVAEPVHKTTLLTPDIIQAQLGISRKYYFTVKAMNYVSNGGITVSNFHYMPSQGR